MYPREALLRAEYQLWYPGIRSRAWFPSALLTRLVRHQLLHRQPRWEMGSRVLSEAHFDFRGGDQDRAAPSDTRHDDRAGDSPDRPIA